MPEMPGTAASVVTYRKVAYVAAAIGTAIAIAVYVFMGRAPLEYQSQAVLSYSPGAGSGAQNAVVSAEKAAARAMDDAHLKTILEGFGLYPEMREASLQAAALSRFRSNILVTQSSRRSAGEVDLHLAFRDPSPLKGPSVANALADVLATYTAPAAVAGLPDSGPDETPAATSPLPADSNPVNASGLAAPSTVVASKVVPGNLAGLSKEQLRRKMNWVDGQLADLATEQSTLHAASTTVQGRISQIQLAGHDEPAVPRETSRQVVDPNAATRIQLAQQLAAEQQKLVALRERYTDAYPDVQTTQANITSLQAKLADLPPPPRQPVVTRHAPDLYQTNVDQLTAEESKLGEKLRDVEHQIAGLEHYRERVRVAALTAPDIAGAQPPPTPPPAVKSTPPPVPSMPARSALHRKHRTGVRTSTALSDSNPDIFSSRPFRIISPAADSVPVHRLSPTVLASVAGGWVILMLICFIPLRWMQSSVIRTGDDVRATLPRQVAYLGHVRRIVQ